MSKKEYGKFLIPKGTTLLKAMEQLENAASRNLYVVDENNCLQGSLSDGDIRRALLNGANMDASIDAYMNKTPRFIEYIDREKTKHIKALMLELNIETIPVLDNNRVVVGIITWIDLFSSHKAVAYQPKSNLVFILAGGTGSRLDPFTRILPKPLIPIDDQPIIEKIMDKFSFYGFDSFILSLFYKSDMIRAYFSDKDVIRKYQTVNFIQEEFPLGTIGSIDFARSKLTDSFFISNADILIEADLNSILHYHQDSGAILTAVGCVKNSVIPYGVLQTDERGLLVNIREKPSCKSIINTGVYVAEPTFLSYIEANTKQDMTDVLKSMLTAGERIGVYPVLEEQWFDIGHWLEYERTRKYFELRK
ncbi:sugar phosphate nucleotidyltransferase [Syntrophomonas wolfei]|uniref:sugar phosphate nucleotidyltransferase n=1 Tax=Syntrophomonas wolfei TaxID=863 RepID=UPI0007737C36|nr:sugar phosphate nucleotidyltransferase [Syntrophomonas wolfei]